MSGLQRRRVGGNGSESPAPSNEPAPKLNNLRNGYEDGKRVAYDPDDINNTAEDIKQPKLTLMEEVLLMGIKDKQVSLCDDVLI